MNTTGSTAPLLLIENLSVDFHTEYSLVHAVQHFSLHIAPGETLAIVGESGSGKTVTSLSVLNLIATKAMHLTADSILFNNAPLLEDGIIKQGIRGRQIAMIFQEPMTSLNPVMTCGKQVTEMLATHLQLTSAEAHRKTIALFEEVKLPRPESIFQSYPHQLSGGQRQRVMIAMAISCSPKLLIADEPTTALDVTVQKSILQLLKALQVKYGMAMIFITHDLGIVAEIADQILVMKKGEVVEAGPAQQLLAHPIHPYTRALLACRPPAGHRIKTLPTVEQIESGVPFMAELNNTPAPHTEPLLEVKNVSKYYHPEKKWFGTAKSEIVKAVDGVSFHVFKGETLGLVGESGCGKTTLSRMLLRLIPADAGDIIYEGKSIVTLPKREMRELRKHIQIIFQDPYSSLNPKHTIGSAITEPMEVFNLHRTAKGRKEKAFDLLQKVGLNATHYHRYPHEFSGGQRQRIVIARALALEPNLLICDEAVSALDVSVQAQVLNLLNDLKKEFGLTYIFISHDLNVVRHMSDRVMVMNHGRIEELNETEALFANPQSQYTRTLIEAVPGRTLSFN